MASLVPLEHDAILERFDSLVKTGVVLYDENQQLITYDDRGYKVSAQPVLLVPGGFGLSLRTSRLTSPRSLSSA